jgi:LysM repeat protein
MDEAPMRNQGITIYFADGGETTWDIAKRYTTTLDTVKKFNPEIGDIAEAGQKILIMS